MRGRPILLVERGREYDLIQPPHRERRLKIDRASSEERGERKRMDLGQAESVVAAAPVSECGRQPALLEEGERE